MNLQVLQDELTNDPLGRGYAAMDNAQAAASLNTVDRTETIPAPLNDVVDKLIEWDALAPINAAANAYEANPGGATNAQSLAYKVVAYTRAVRDYNLAGIDFTRPHYSALLTAMVNYNVLTQAQADELAALGTRDVSRAQELGLGRVRPSDVNQARV